MTESHGAGIQLVPPKSWLPIADRIKIATRLISTNTAMTPIPSSTPRPVSEDPLWMCGTYLLAYWSIAADSLGDGVTGRSCSYHDHLRPPQPRTSDRKSTRLNSSHLGISYAVFC